MTIPEIISGPEKGFSIEVLPPLKGRGIGQLFTNIDRLLEYGPRYVNITTHRSEQIYKPSADGLYQRVSERSRPGTVAVAAAIQQRYSIPAVPHIICSGYTRLETEYALIDLNFLGITNLLLLRGDKARHESRFMPTVGGHSHASDLQGQVNDFNKGLFIDGTEMDIVGDNRPVFSYGVAGYPEKHEESPNGEIDLEWLKRKVDLGAEYIVTQMCFDNDKLLSFIERCRRVGISVPIIPGLKPICNASQLTILPRVFHCDLPTDLVRAVEECRGDNTKVKEVGVEWLTAQMRELYEAGLPSVHLYSLNATESVGRALKNIFG
ncbi:MAG: methylenetetrahydrofolate reductase [Pseudoflavonifractor sp.]|nr:methylenetetrahydrofolate reductase [Alloprevotella sp.]MCM1116354.1 methylenetetrahydrofolate reductase [Pseudoflavonifractor sp.]